MKRLTYISRIVSDNPERDLREIERISQRNNARDGITGVLIYIGGYFFQLVEGPDEAIDRLYERLLRDTRHAEMVVLQTELNVSERLFPIWTMEVFNLEQRSEVFILPLRVLLQSLLNSHHVIGRYTQHSVVHMLAQGLNPLTVPLRRVERVVLFGDILGFTILTEALGEEQVFDLVGTYLDLCTQVIEAQGGEANKFIGDSIMAYFPAERADAALQSVLEVLEALAKIREKVAPNHPLRLLYSGFGLAGGMVLEGNLGKVRKLDYTVVGDTVNTASRLQSLTRELGYQILFTEKVCQLTRRPWPFVKLGEQRLRGKEAPLTLFTLDDPRACCLMKYDTWHEHLQTLLKERQKA